LQIRTAPAQVAQEQTGRVRELPVPLEVRAGMVVVRQGYV
tara:strand:- start:581 stop:700 length:120 start_codon:yes stop_codon:yes gene_type:complete